MLILLTAVTVALGLAVGSFLNVVVWRLPRHESVVAPASHCPNCDVPIAHRDNIPIVGWLLLRARCRACGTHISARYPMVELLTATVFGLLTWRLGASWELPAFLFLGAIGVALALIDLDIKRLPDAIVLPSYPIAALLLCAAAALETSWTPLWHAAVAGAALFAFYFIVWFIYPAGMGFGDVKLSGILGMFLGWLGWGALLVGAFGGFVVGGVGAVCVLLFRGGGRKTMIPYGPYMLIGALLAILAGSQLADAYVDAFIS